MNRSQGRELQDCWISSLGKTEGLHEGQVTGVKRSESRKADLTGWMTA